MKTPEIIELPLGFGQGLESLMRSADATRQQLLELEKTIQLMLQEFASASGLDPAEFRFDRDKRALVALKPQRSNESDPSPRD